MSTEQEEQDNHDEISSQHQQQQEQQQQQQTEHDYEVHLVNELLETARPASSSSQTPLSVSLSAPCLSSSFDENSSSNSSGSSREEEEETRVDPLHLLLCGTSNQQDEISFLFGPPKCYNHNCQNYNNDRDNNEDDASKNSYKNNSNHQQPCPCCTAAATAALHQQQQQQQQESSVPLSPSSGASVSPPDSPQRKKRRSGNANKNPKAATKASLCHPQQDIDQVKDVLVPILVQRLAQEQLKNDNYEYQLRQVKEQYTSQQFTMTCQNQTIISLEEQIQHLKLQYKKLQAQYNSSKLQHETYRQRQEWQYWNVSHENQQLRSTLQSQRQQLERHKTTMKPPTRQEHDYSRSRDGSSGIRTSSTTRDPIEEIQRILQDENHDLNNHDYTTTANGGSSNNTMMHYSDHHHLDLGSISRSGRKRIIDRFPYSNTNNNNREYNPRHTTPTTNPHVLVKEDNRNGDGIMRDGSNYNRRRPQPRSTLSFKASTLRRKNSSSSFKSSNTRINNNNIHATTTTNEFTSIPNIYDDVYPFSKQTHPQQTEDRGKGWNNNHSFGNTTSTTNDDYDGDEDDDTYPYRDKENVKEYSNMSNTVDNSCDVLFVGWKHHDEEDTPPPPLPPPPPSLSSPSSQPLIQKKQTYQDKEDDVIFVGWKHELSPPFSTSFAVTPPPPPPLQRITPPSSPSSSSVSSSSEDEDDYRHVDGSRRSSNMNNRDDSSPSSSSNHKVITTAGLNRFEFF